MSRTLNTLSWKFKKNKTGYINEILDKRRAFCVTTMTDLNGKSHCYLTSCERIPLSSRIL